jgi:zinc transport system substrate-binding protein
VKKLYFGVLLVLAAVIITACGNKSEQAHVQALKNVNADGKLKVVTTFYPLYEFASQTGGDRVNVYNLMPPGAEPHDWEPAPRDMASIEQADLFIYNGAGLEPWVEQRLLPVLAGKKVKVLDASAGQKLISASKGTYDPHYWLDPLMARHTVESIAAAISEIDPNNGQYYRERASAYGEKLLKLDKEYSAAAQSFTSKDLVTSHSAFAYMCRRYGMQQVSVLGLSPEAQPSPAQLKEVAEFVRQNKVRCIFFEPLTKPRQNSPTSKVVG